MEIKTASLSDLKVLSELFDGYRTFYRQQSDIEASRVFLKARLENEEAHAFIAWTESNQAAGFTLLYPSFSSVSQGRTYILNDLFVRKEFRRRGVGALLLDYAVEFGRKNGAIRLHLETEITNVKAQKLYEKEGWQKDVEEYHYFYTL